MPHPRARSTASWSGQQQTQLDERRVSTAPPLTCTSQAFLSTSCVSLSNDFPPSHVINIWSIMSPQNSFLYNKDSQVLSPSPPTKKEVLHYSIKHIWHHKSRNHHQGFALTWRARYTPIQMSTAAMTHPFQMRQWVQTGCTSGKVLFMKLSAPGSNKAWSKSTSLRLVCAGWFISNEFINITSYFHTPRPPLTSPFVLPPLSLGYFWTLYEITVTYSIQSSRKLM